MPWWAVTFGLALAVYLLTLSRDVGAWDIAEMQTIPHLFGVAHPTGYPTFTIIGGIWSRIPFGSVAVRMNLLSAVLFAGAASASTAVAVRLRVRGSIACASGLVFAFATGTWRNAVHAEVQSLHLFLLALAILFWIAAREEPTPRNVAVLCLVIGVGLSHHGLMTLMALPILGSLVASRWRAILDRRVLQVAVPALILPLTFLLYLPLREGSAPLLDSNPQRSWWGKIRGEGFRGTMGKWRSLKIWADAIGSQLHLLSGWVGVVVLLLAVLGIGSLARKSPTTAACLLAIGLLASYAQANSTDANDRYVLGSVLVIAMFAAVAVDSLADALADLSSKRTAPLVALSCSLAFSLVPLNGLRANYRALDAHSVHRNEDNGTLLLNALPTNCVLWTYWDLRTELFYLRYIEHVRPDVTILDHRSTRTIGSSFAASPEGVYRAVTNDARYVGRPVCFVPIPGQRSSGEGVSAASIANTDLPWGIGYLGRGRVYVLTAAP